MISPARETSFNDGALLTGRVSLQPSLTTSTRVAPSASPPAITRTTATWCTIRLPEPSQQLRARTEEEERTIAGLLRMAAKLYLSGRAGELY